MAFFDYNQTPHHKLMDGVHAAIHHSDHHTFAHVTLEHGALVPEHHHIQEQWTHVLEGELELTVAGETRILSSGQSAYIPADVPHRAKALTRCKVMDAFIPVREDFKSLPLWEE